MEIDRLEEKLVEDVSISPIQRYNTEILDAIELKNMLTCARMIATSARIRKESRGAHLRLDYPDKDDRDWLKNITLWKGKNSIETSVSNAMVPDIDGD
jgi:succinate dehydrogenase/fumarate reductase flavoprotein subunit